MNSINLNGIDIDRNDINDIYIDSHRNITLTLRDKRQIIVERSDESRRVYKQLTEEDD